MRSSFYPPQKKGVPFLTAGSSIFGDLLLHHIKLGSHDAGSIFRVYFQFKNLSEGKILSFSCWKKKILK